MPGAMPQATHPTPARDPARKDPERLPRAVWLLLMGTFLIHVGSYMVVPYLMVLLPQNVAVSTLTAAALVFVVKFSVKASSVIGGPLADRLGTRRMLVLGLLLRATGMAAFALTRHVGWLFAASMVAGLGSGLYAPATRGAIGSLTPPPLRTHAFSLRAVAANLGMATAPLAVLVLAPVDVDLVFLASAGLFAALALVTHRALPDLPAQTSESLLAILKEVATDRRWLVFGTLVTLAWSLYGHLDSNVMVWANELAGLGGMTAVAAGYAVLVAVLQTPVTRYVASRVRSWDMVTLGTALTAAGLLAVGLARGPGGAAVAVTLFALGATLLVPGADLVTSDLAPPNRVNTYFGAASLFSTLGMAMSAPLGAALLTRWPGSPLPWSLLAGMGFALVLGFLVVGRKPHQGGTGSGPAG